jgi:signal transduction histidine kinase
MSINKIMNDEVHPTDNASDAIDSVKLESAGEKPFHLRIWSIFARSIRLKVSLLILLPVLLALLLSTLIEFQLHRERDLRNMSLLASQTGHVIQQSLRHEMLLSDFEGIQSTLDAIWADEQFRALYILDKNGKVVFSPSEESTSLSLDNEEESCQPCHRLAADDRPSGILITTSDGQQVFRSMHPIENKPECAECHNPDDRIIGLLLTDLSIESVEEAVVAGTRSSLLWWIGALLATTIIANLAINQFVLQRLGRLTEAIRNFSLGKKNPQLPVTSEDEIGKLSEAFNAMSSRVELHEKENKALTEALDNRIAERGVLLKRLIHAQEEERKRIAREIHDEFGQSLSSIALNIELTHRALAQDPNKATDHLSRAGELVANSTDQMYNLILGLRPSALDDLGLIAALKSHIHRTLEPAGIGYDFQTEALTDRLPPQIETTLFRLIQEALTNIIRHAGASRVTLSISLRNGVIQGDVIDDGVGFDPSSIRISDQDEQGLGLLGMRERVEQFGGTLDVDSSPGSGTRIRIRLPIEAIRNA